MKKQKEYDDDDGRTIANMNVEGMPWYRPKSSQEPAQNEKKEEIHLTFGEKLAMIGGVLKAALLVGLVFIVAYFLLILLLTHIW